MLVACALAPVLSLAQATHTWTGATNSSWATGTNWNTGLVPVTGDSVVLTNVGTSPNNNNLVGVNLLSVTQNRNNLDLVGNPIVLKSGGSITANTTGSIINRVRSPSGVTLNGPATFTLGAGADSLFIEGAVTGTGGLALVNNGTSGRFGLSTVNSYSGSTTVSGLRIGADINGSIPTGSALTVTGSIEFGTSSTIGSLAGSGNVFMGGTNTLTVGGDNSSTTFSGVYQTSGVAAALTKVGSGTLTLTGANTYSGGTTINAGTLRAGGAANALGSGAVTVGTGATLDLGSFGLTVGAGSTFGGTGTTSGAVTIARGGILAPGNSIGTVSVTGSVTFNAGSIYRVEADAAGNADRINVTGAPGTATISGGTVDVQASAGTYQSSTQYTILNATGGVTGTFSTVTSNLAFLTPSLSYNANNVFLTLVRNDIGFAAVAATANQSSIATVLQASAAGASGDLATVVNALTGLSAGQARTAFDSIGGGAAHVSLQRAGTAFAGGFGQQLNRRLALVARDDSAERMASFGSPIQLAANDWLSDARPIYAQAGAATASSSTDARAGRGFWIRAYGAQSDTESDGNAAGNKLRGGGLSAGADTEWRDGLVLGVAGTAGRSRVSMNGVSDSGRMRGTAIGAYGSYVEGPWTFKGVAGLAWNDNHADRSVTAGAIARTATSDFDSRSHSFYAEATYDLKMKSYTLQPLAAFSHVRTKADGFTESGAGALNLQVSEQTTRSTRSLLGAKTIHEIGRVKLDPRVLWAHEYGNVNAPMTASLSGAPAAGSFQVSGVELKRDSLVLGLGASGTIAKDVTLFADLQTEHSSRQKTYAAFVGVRGVW